MQNFSQIFKSISYVTSLLLDCGPSDAELRVIASLQDKISTKFDVGVHEHYLKQLHSLCDIGEYEVEGPSWKKIGFQRGGPTSDVRGGGILCLENLIYFLTTSSAIALDMCQSRSGRGIVEIDGQLVGLAYPWAAASISMTRLVANELSITDKVRGTPVPLNKMPAASAYHLLLEPNAFNRLYCLVFILFDHEFTQMQGTYLMFPAVLKHVEAVVHAMLQSPIDMRACAKFVAARVGGKYAIDIASI
jgi:hypothetical protein